MTKLGRLVKDGKIKSLEEIYLFSLPIKVSSESVTWPPGGVYRDEFFTRRSSDN